MPIWDPLLLWWDNAAWQPITSNRNTAIMQYEMRQCGSLAELSRQWLVGLAAELLTYIWFSPLGCATTMQTCCGVKSLYNTLNILQAARQSDPVLPLNHCYTISPSLPSQWPPQKVLSSCLPHPFEKTCQRLCPSLQKKSLPSPPK